MQLNKLNIRDFYRNNINTTFQKNNVLYENALSSISSTSRLSRPLVEDYFNQCTTYENANKNNDKLISLLEQVLIEEKSSLYNKLEGIYINNIIPKLENGNIKYSISLIESSSIINDDKILNELKDYLVCDRIITNYDKLDSKFNITESIEKSYYRDKNECIYEICEYIDRYNISKSSKYDIALESIVYGFFRNKIDCSTSQILENVTDYFLLENTSDIDYDKMRNVLTRNPLITESSKECIKYFIESENFADSDDVKDLLKKYKTEQIKDEGKLKYYIKRIYAKHPSQIIDETPNFLAWLRLGFVMSTAAFNPIITIPIFIVDQFISMTFKRDQAEKMVSIFEKELKKMEKKKSNKKVDSYIKCLNSCISKLQQYRDSLYSEKELQKREELEEVVNNLDNLISITEVQDNSEKITRELNSVFKKIPDSIKNIIDKNTIDSFNKSSILEFVNTDSELDFNIVTLENTSYKEAESITETINRALPNNYIALLESSNDTLSIHAIRKNRILLDDNEKEQLQSTIPYDLKKSFTSIINISEATSSFMDTDPDSLNDRIYNGFDNLMEDPIRSCRLMSTCKDLIDIDKISEMVEEYRDKNNPIQSTMISNAKKELYKEHIEFSEDIKLVFISEAIKHIDSIISEGVNVNTLKTAALNLRKKAQNLSTKEKEISRNIDITMNGLQRSIEKALTTDKREAIIKGSIIPSFSKIIKFAIAATGAYLISPTIAVIGVIGSLGISKSLTHRERKLLLDEIDVELKVLEKQISACEDSNPNKYRQLLTCQRKLEREKMRIKYNLSKDRQVVPGVNIVTDKNPDD